MPDINRINEIEQLQTIGSVKPMLQIRVLTSKVVRPE